MRKLASTMDRSISLTVAITDAVASKVVSSGTLYAQFIPAVHAVTTELTLTNRQRTGSVVLRGVEMALKSCQVCSPLLIVISSNVHENLLREKLIGYRFFTFD